MFKLQHEFLILIDICVSWTSPRTDLETNFSNLGNRNFKKLNFSQEQQKGTFSHILDGSKKPLPLPVFPL